MAALHIIIICFSYHFSFHPFNVLQCLFSASPCFSKVVVLSLAGFHIIIICFSYNLSFQPFNVLDHIFSASPSCLSKVVVFSLAALHVFLIVFLRCFSPSTFNSRLQLPDENYYFRLKEIYSSFFLLSWTSPQAQVSPSWRITQSFVFLFYPFLFLLSPLFHLFLPTSVFPSSLRNFSIH